MEFKEFPKMGRLSREMIITEKIDGTNSSIFIQHESLEEDLNDTYIIAKKEGYTMRAGSRTKWLKSEEYNQNLQDIIKDSLKTASEKAEVEVLNGYMEEPDEQEYVEQIFSEGNYRVKPYKESITNTFEETFNKYKL